MPSYRSQSSVFVCWRGRLVLLSGLRDSLLRGIPISENPVQGPQFVLNAFNSVCVQFSPCVPVCKTDCWWLCVEWRRTFHQSVPDALRKSAHCNTGTFFGLAACQPLRQAWTSAACHTPFRRIFPWQPLHFRNNWLLLVPLATQNLGLRGVCTCRPLSLSASCRAASLGVWMLA